MQGHFSRSRTADFWILGEEMNHDFLTLHHKVNVSMFTHKYFAQDLQIAMQTLCKTGVNGTGRWFNL